MKKTRKQNIRSAEDLAKIADSDGNVSRFFTGKGKMMTGAGAPKRTRDYEEDLIEKLKDTKFAIEYLNASLEDEDDGAEERFLIALRQVAKAHGIA